MTVIRTAPAAVRRWHVAIACTCRKAWRACSTSLHPCAEMRTERFDSVAAVSYQYVWWCAGVANALSGTSSQRQKAAKRCDNGFVLSWRLDRPHRRWPAGGRGFPGPNVPEKAHRRRVAFGREPSQSRWWARGATHQCRSRNKARAVATPCAQVHVALTSGEANSA